ncbi:Protein of unknown function [Caldanaerobius fijiensis DSM 17918]|uniref:DUF2508 domain-containing protein n=1 Tax=Caldanaerobius fijiensis DSM 17918 TaxID=1121256 RepID=A0A1M4X733_9THEO|nr:YaaL family protein [Caldanaerobius fijiensis]SHE88922.1 Protein of unknown function [Caldanaerobius fijiensis DSM 17918]
MYSKFVRSVAAAFVSMIGSQSQNKIVDEKQAYIDIIEKAREEMQIAERYFETVSDPDLVDHAIFQLEAARKKYIYLLKCAQSQGINLSSKDVLDETDKGMVM